MLPARYADGQTALSQAIECEIQGGGIHFIVGGRHVLWRYVDILRVDDGNGDISFRRTPDSGERLSFGYTAQRPLQEAAPHLFTQRALGVEAPVVPITLAAIAFSLAATFLVGAPYLAGPAADALPPAYREQLSDIAWSQVNMMAPYCDESDEASRALNAMAHRMMTAADVSQRDDIWITIVDTPLPNAFALPDQSIIVTSGLIALTEHPDELTGVIAHEIAHIESNHVIKNIVRNIGAGIFFDVVFGGAGVGQAIAIASVNLAGLRYSRGYEAEADALGLDYLDAGGIDTGGLARLFDRLRTEGADGGELPAILSSHPPTPQRAEIARARSRPGLAPSLTDVEWASVRTACAAAPAAEPSAENNLPPSPAPEPPQTSPPPRRPQQPVSTPPARPRAAPQGPASTPRARGPGPVEVDPKP